MNTNNPNLELWNTIERYFTGQLTPRERLDFEDLKAGNKEVAEMVVFYRSLELKEQYDNLSSTTEAEWSVREALNDEAADDPRLAAQLVFDQELRLAARTEGLSALLDDLKHRRGGSDANPGIPEPPALANNLRRILLITMVTILGLVLGGLIYRAFFTDTVVLPEVPDYAYGLTQDTEQVKTFFGDGNYSRARAAFIRQREAKLASGFYDEETIDIYNFYIAICELRLGKWNNARHLLEDLAGKEMALEGQPQELFLGLIYYQQGRRQEARYWLTSAAGSTGNLNDGTPIADVANRYLGLLTDF